MKRILLNKFFLFILFCTVALCSCGVWSLDSKVKQLRLGMSKQEVVNVLGTSYTHLEAIAVTEGDLETIAYSDNLYGNSYTIRFLNDKLVEWFAGTPNRTPVPVVVPVPHAGHN